MPVRTQPKLQLSASYNIKSSTIESIDYALYNFVNDRLNIHVTTNKGFEKIPIIFSIPERAHQVKNIRTTNDQEIRPNGRTLNYPLISIAKTSVTQNPSNKGRYGVNLPPYFDYYNPGGAIPIARQIKQDKTANYANANAIRKSDGGMNANRQTFPGDNKNVVYETLLVPVPTFIECVYNVSIVTEYQQQMNEVLSTFHTLTGDPAVFSITYESNTYEAFVDPSYNIDFKPEGIDLNERVFDTTISIKVLGYLLGAQDNQDTPLIVKRQSAAKIRFSRERSMLGEEPDFHAGRKDKFRP
jgi:hypothetical protein